MKNNILLDKVDVRYISFANILRYYNIISYSL